MSEQIHTTPGTANNEILCRHLTVARNSENEASMREYSLRQLEANMYRMDAQEVVGVKRLRARLTARINTQAKTGTGLAMKKA